MGEPDAPDDGRPWWIGRRSGLLCALLLILSALALRLPTLDVVALNPDESQYEAIAVYVVESGGSEFDRPETIGGGFTLYRIATEWFGRYPSRVLRLFVLALDIVAALLLYAAVSRAGGRAAGVVAGLAFQHWAIAFEGFSANREWFAIVPVLAAIAIAQRRIGDDRRSAIAWGVCGLLAGSALWFKVQALGLLIAVPALILFDARRGTRLAATRLVAYVVGGVVAGALYVAPIVAHGMLGRYVEMISSGWAEYVQPPAAASGVPSGFGATVSALYLTLPSRGLVTLAYGAAVVLGAAAAARALTRSAADRTLPRSIAAGLFGFSALAIGASWSVSLGGRFFAHYFLMLVPAVAGLVGLTFGLATRRRNSSLVPLAILGLYALERCQLWLTHGPFELLRQPARAPLFLLGIAVLVVVSIWVALKPARRGWQGVALMIILELALLVIPTQLGSRPRSLPHHRPGFDALSAKLSSLAGPQDSIFVWGWLPELYTLSGLRPASHHATSQYVVRDFSPSQELGLDLQAAEQLVESLERARPSWVIDAASRSWTMAAGDDPYRYDLARLPPFGLRSLLEREYVRLGRIDGCVVYRLRDHQLEGLDASAPQQAG